MASTVDIVFTKEDIDIVTKAIHNIIKAANAKNNAIKAHSTEAKVLQANKDILSKLVGVAGSNESEQGITLTRPEVKVLAAGLITVSAHQAKILAEYQRRPDNHPSFGESPNRTKEHYVTKLQMNLDRLNAAALKVGKAIHRM